MSQIPGLAISLDNQPVSNLVSSKIKFINTGNETINSKDFAAAEPLSIRVSGHFLGMQHECHISSSNPNTLPQIKRINEDLMKLDFDFLKPKQSFSITVLHDGKLLVSGELKAGKVKEYHRKIGAAEILSSFPIIGSFVLGLFFMLINGYFSLNSLMSITMSGTILSLALRQIFSLPAFRIFDNLKMMLSPLDDEE